jgi:hypothetical protein
LINIIVFVLFWLTETLRNSNVINKYRRKNHV